MKVCDRCKKEIDTNRKTLLNGDEFELCTSCAEYIANHIRNYKGQQKQNIFQMLFNPKR